MNILITLSILLGFVIYANCCDMNQTQHGCSIDQGKCVCSFGCKSEFRYRNRRICMDALKGRNENICNRRPCMHGGSCIQVTDLPGYRCRCEGTGYYGTRCQTSCERLRTSTSLPLECITI